MKTSKHKSTEQLSKRANHLEAQAAPTPEQLRQRAHDIYVAHGGAERMTLNEWLEAEQALKRQLQVS